MITRQDSSSTITGLLMYEVRYHGPFLLPFLANTPPYLKTDHIRHDDPLTMTYNRLKPGNLDDLINVYLEQASAIVHRTWNKSQECVIELRNRALKDLTMGLEKIDEAKHEELCVREGLVQLFGAKTVDDKWSLKPPSPSPEAIARAREQLASVIDLLRPESRSLVPETSSQPLMEDRGGMSAPPQGTQKPSDGLGDVVAHPHVAQANISR